MCALITYWHITNVIGTKLYREFGIYTIINEMAPYETRLLRTTLITIDNDIFIWKYYNNKKKVGFFDADSYRLDSELITFLTSIPLSICYFSLDDMIFFSSIRERAQERNILLSSRVCIVEYQTRLVFTFFWSWRRRHYDYRVSHVHTYG